MKNFSKFIVAAAAMAVVGSTANAQTVTYSTTGAFSGGSCGGLPGQCTIGAATLSFTGVTGVMVSAPSNISFGDFLTTMSGISPQNFAGTSFTLNVTQSAPTVGGNMVMGTITGQLSATGSTLYWLPATSTFSIGTVNYRLQSPPEGYALVAPNSNGGLTTIQGTITTVPEPSTYALMAAGLAAMGLVARRRRQTNA